MKKAIFLTGLLLVTLFATQAQLLTPPQGGSMRASVTEWVGLTQVTINYGRPAVNGRDGKIWGGVVYTGFQKLGYGNGNDAPWRAGANENTTIEFTTDVLINDHPLAAGKYGFFIAYDPNGSTLIFSHNNFSWGSYFYDPKEDALRVVVKPVALTESKERLSFEFSGETDSSAIVSLKWEKLAIPFTLTTQLQKQQLASFDREMRGDKGFDPHSMEQVANYYLEHNIRLQEALAYINQVIENSASFSAFMTKSQIQEKLNMQAQADSSAKQAMPLGSAIELHTYARGLLKEKKIQKAFEIFQLNYDRHPNTFTTNMGLTRGYAALGKTKDALKYANKALPMAPDAQNKKAVESIIEKLKDGKEI